MKIPSALRLTLLAMLGATGAAQAQNSATPLIPDLNDFALPGSRPATDSPAPTPTPTSAPPTSQPVASSAPRPLTPVATPTPRPIVTPTRTPIERATPVPLPTAGASPVAVATPVPASPTPVATSASGAAVPAPAASASDAEQPGESRFWLWIGLGLAVVAAASLALLRAVAPSRRKETRADRTIEIRSDDPTPVAAPKPKVAPVAPPVSPASPEVRARIEIAMRPIRAGTNLTSGAVEYEIDLRNSGDAPATGIRIDIRLMNASVQQDAMLKALFAQAIDKPLTAPFDLALGQAISVGGIAMIPREAILPVAIAGREFFVPVFAVNVLYAWADAGQGQSAAAWVVGIERAGSDKMAPFRIDTGPRMYDVVGQRAQGLAIRG